jgi:hypothetical protein
LKWKKQEDGRKGHDETDPGTGAGETEKVHSDRLIMSGLHSNGDHSMRGSMLQSRIEARYYSRMVGRCLACLPSVGRD